MTELAEILKEKKKTLKRVTLEEYLTYEPAKNNDPYCVNIRGANGSGKSTFPIQMLLMDERAYLLTENGKDIATVFPSFHMIALGKYYIRTGGMDSGEYHDKEYGKYMLDKLWKCGNNLLFEGMTVSSSYDFWRDTLLELQEKYPGYRRVMIMNLIMPLDKLEERIKIRNGGKDINMKHVQGKLNTVLRNVKKFEADGFNSWVASTENVGFGDMLKWFFKQLHDHKVVKKVEYPK